MSASSRAGARTVDPAGPGPLLRVSRLWWERLPSLVARVSPAFGNALTDGLHYVRWPAASALAPPLSLAGGAVLASLHDEPSFTSSPVLLVVLVVVAIASVQLGAWSWLGFTAVELAGLGQPRVGLSSGPLAGLGHALAVVDQALLLALLSIGVPTAVLAIRLGYRGMAPPALQRLPLEALVALVAGAASTYVWAQSTVLLVRPVFTLQGRSPTVEAVASVQEGWPLLVGAAVAATGGRLLVERRAAHSPAFLAATVRAAAVMSRRAGTRRPPAAVRIVLGAAAGTLLLAGLVATPVLAVVTFGVLAVLGTVGSRLRARGAPRALAAVPVLLRLVLLVPVLYLVTRVVLGLATSSGSWRSESFVAPWLSVLLCTAAAVLVLSPTAGGETSTGTRRAEP